MTISFNFSHHQSWSEGTFSLVAILNEQIEQSGTAYFFGAAAERVILNVSTAWSPAASAASSNRACAR